MKTPKITRLLETALYLDDVGQGVRFYQELFEFPLLSGAAQPEATFAALELPGEAVLLFFKRGANAQPLETGGGIIPPHGGEGRLHLAFAISAGSYESWKTKLITRNIPIESEVRTWRPKSLFSGSGKQPGGTGHPWAVGVSLTRLRLVSK